MRPPTLATYEEFIHHFENDTDNAFRLTAWKQYEFACKERDRLNANHKRRRLRIREAIPPEQRKKLGRPPKPVEPKQPKPRGRPRKNGKETTALGSDIPA
jgi:hypothetical protein